MTCATARGARKEAHSNTIRLNNEKADLIEWKYGWEARQAFSAQVARNFKVHVERYYCGSAFHIEGSTYDRELALRHAYAFSRNGIGDADDEYLLSLIFPGYRNPLYPTFGGNCANFVSQVLHEGASR